MLWKNWSESVVCSPESMRYPTSQAEIVAILKECRQTGKKLRVVGSGHSFTPLVATDQVIVSLEGFQGLLHVDQDQQQVTVKAGTTIQNLGKLLLEQGLGQLNLGDIDKQSIAGAISTGTHGTGVTLGSVATQVVALTLVTASGEVIVCSETQNRDIFKAAQVSLGALGIITEVTLQCRPAYRLHYQWKKLSLVESLANLERYKQENRHFEFYWIPYSDVILGKFMNITEAPAKNHSRFRKFNEMALENGVFWLFSEMARKRPAASPRIARTLASLITAGEDIQYASQIFATPRLVKFQEMEYNFPAEHFVDVFNKIRAFIEDNRIEVHFPLECRFVHSDDIDLSPAYGRDSAYIAVHMYKGMEYRHYFEGVEAIFKEYGGRPHWGKMHTRTADELRQLYPRWEAFQQVRHQLDPEGFFLNDHLRKVLC